jgi:hypothetical protein
VARVCVCDVRVLILGGANPILQGNESTAEECYILTPVLNHFFCTVRSLTHSLSHTHTHIHTHTRAHAYIHRYDAIAAGDYPEWTLFIQTMDPKDEDK